MSDKLYSDDSSLCTVTVMSQRKQTTIVSDRIITKIKFQTIYILIIQHLSGLHATIFDSNVY